MRLSRFLPTLFLSLAVAAGAQQSNPPANPPSGVQPQVWPPAQTPVQQQVPAAPSTAPAQPNASQLQRAQRLLSEAHGPAGQIQLDVEVTDKDGHPIPGLERGDFTLLDDNRPAAIESFQAFSSSVTPQPLEHIIMIIDEVNIGFQEVSYSRFGIDQFLRSNGGKLPAPMSIYWYTDTGLKGNDEPSADGNVLAAQLDATAGELRALNRTAGAWGAIERFNMSLQMLEKVVRAAAGYPGRKLLIWVGPGWPMLDGPNIQMTWKQQQSLFQKIVELSGLIRQAQMSIYSVMPGMPNQFTYLYQSYVKGVKKPSQANVPDLDLKVLAVQSGGVVISPNNDLGGQIVDCVRDATAWYTIGFTPPPADGPNEYHQLKVRVDKPGLTARTSTGYYDQPEGAPVR